MASAREKTRPLWHLYVMDQFSGWFLVLVYAHWWAWYGGWIWGPRFLLFASIPPPFSLAVRLHYWNDSLIGNLVTLLAFALSVWVGINGAVFGQQALGICVVQNYSFEFCATISLNLAFCGILLW